MLKWDSPSCKEVKILVCFGRLTWSLVKDHQNSLRIYNKSLTFYYIYFVKPIKLSLARLEFIFLYIFQQYIKKLHNCILLLFFKFARAGPTYEFYSVFTCLLISAFTEMGKYLPFPNIASRIIFLNTGNFSKTVRSFFQNDNTHNGDSSVLNGKIFLNLPIKENIPIDYEWQISI